MNYYPVGTTIALAHRRDHEHWGLGDCPNHDVEVVSLKGRRRLAICHDCRWESHTGDAPSVTEAANEHRMKVHH